MEGDNRREHDGDRLWQLHLMRFWDIVMIAATSPSGGAGAPPVWILATGTWNDAGVWVDSDVWKDA